MQIGIVGLLGILFIALKLMNFIAWSWLWVLAPFWLGTAIGLIFWVGILVLACVAGRR